MRESSVDNKKRNNVSLTFSIISAVSMLFFGIASIFYFIFLVYYYYISDSQNIGALKNIYFYGLIVMASVGGIGGACGVIFGSLYVKRGVPGEPLEFSYGILIGGFDVILSILMFVWIFKRFIYF